MISPALSGHRVWSREQCVHLWLFQVRDQCLGGLFVWHRPHLAAPFDQFGSMHGDESGKSMNGRQALIPGGDSTPSLLLQVTQEQSYAVYRNVDDVQTVNRFAGAPGDIREQQSKRVAIAPLGIPGKVAFAYQVFHQEPADPGA